MTKKIVAIGGGENGRVKSDGTKEPYETGPMDQEIIKLTGKEHPNFLFLAHSQLHSLDIQNLYFKTMKNIYNGIYGCDCKILRSEKVADKELVKELFNWADIIYEGGGNTLDMIDFWKETGLDKLLREAWQNGKVMCGVSAGANCWFKECSSDSLQIKYGPDQPLIIVECLSFYDGLFVPHCDELGRQESVKELLKEKDSIALQVSNCAALEIVNNQFRIITSDASNHQIEPYALKTYWENGTYIEEQIPISLEYQDIETLLTKSKKRKTK